MSLYRVNCVRIDSKEEFYFRMATDATDLTIIESQAKSEALVQEAEIISISEEPAREEPASMNFAETLEYVSMEIWNSRHPERLPLEWESEYLVQEMLSWLSEEDSYKSVRMEVDIIEEYGLPLEWSEELKSMIEFLKESLTDVGDYI